MQERIDAGILWCEPCDSFGYHRFCGKCGRRYIGAELTWRDCPNKSCAAQVSTDWCPVCGTSVADEFLRKLEAGEVDLEAESEIAASIMQKFYEARPELAPESACLPPATLKDAVIAAFEGSPNG